MRSCRQGLRLRKQRSTGELEKRHTAGGGSIRSTHSASSWQSSDSTRSHVTNGSYHTESNASFVVEVSPGNIGRCGVSQRTDSRGERVRVQSAWDEDMTHAAWRKQYEAAEC